MADKDVLTCKDCKYWDKTYFQRNLMTPIPDRGVCKNEKVLKVFNVFHATPEWFGCIFAERRKGKDD